MLIFIVFRFLNDSELPQMTSRRGSKHPIKKQAKTSPKSESLPEGGRGGGQAPSAGPSGITGKNTTPRPEQSKPRTVLVAGPNTSTPRTVLGARPNTSKPQTGLVARPETSTPRTGPVARPDTSKQQTVLAARPDTSTPRPVHVARPNTSKPQTVLVAREEPQRISVKGDSMGRATIGRSGVVATEGRRLHQFPPSDAATARAPSVLDRHQRSAPQPPISKIK